jgi:outer membrane protein OmpA-like peptidoglycan-associated protein
MAKYPIIIRMLAPVLLSFSMSASRLAIAQGACLDSIQSIRAGQNDLDLEAIIHAAILNSGCSGIELARLGRTAAETLYERSTKKRMSTAERTALLSRALTLGRPWQVLAATADTAMDAKLYDVAAEHYQEALDDIRNETANPIAPDPVVIASLIKKAEAASLLASTYVARVDRGGGPGGLACQTVRGFTVQRTALPVEFDYKEPGFKKTGTEALTAKGRAAAEDLNVFLTKQGSPPINLIGHTDPIAGDDYNQALSERRAEAVKAFLLAKGYTGSIRTSGKGRSQPFVADDPGSYTE